MKSTNKDGQAIGRKGAESRARLLEATRQLLDELPSARKLTASSIARAAGLASQTFYLYFDDVEEILLSLSASASADTAGIIAAVDAPWELANPRAHTTQIVEAFYQYWDRHRSILNIRNYMADRGDEPFVKVRSESALPIIAKLAATMRLGQGDTLSEGDARARAIIIFSAIERMAARYAGSSGSATPPGGSELKRAEADILALLISPPR
jgi:AcrR family transcriptional regulator